MVRKIKEYIIIISLGIMLFLVSSCRTENEIHLLPKNFKGVVMIIYDQKDGEDLVTKDGSVIYKIPPSGILKTKNTFQEGLAQIRYYYDTKPKKTEIKYIFNINKMINDSIYAFGGTSGIHEEVGFATFELVSYIIGTKKDVDSLLKVREKQNAFELIN